MKIHKDLNVIMVKDKKLDIFKSYKLWMSVGILSSICITIFAVMAKFYKTPLILL